MKYKSLYIVFASALLILFVLIYEGSFAYFAATVTTENGEIGGNITAADLQDLTLVNGKNTDNELWLPGTSKDFSFTINPGNMDLCVNLVWTDVTNTWVNQKDLVYTLKDSKGNIIQDSEDKEIKEVQFPSTSKEDIKIAGPIKVPKEGEAQTYTLTVTYKETEENQNSDMEKSFSAKVEGRLTECSTGGGVVDPSSNPTPFPDSVFANVIDEETGTGEQDAEGNGLYTVDHSNDEGTTLGNEWKEQLEYRYAGPNPNNYVWFNCGPNANSGETCEKWRIIGLVDVKVDKGNDKTAIEQRLKIVRDDKLTNDMAWDEDKQNDWTKASLMTYLNSGDYYTDQLKDNAKGMIDESIIWNIGGWSTSSVKTAEVYVYERGETVYGNGPTEWKKDSTNRETFHSIALPYASDYAYATSGGTLGRKTCFGQNLFYSGWNSGVYQTQCAATDWLRPESGSMWLLSPRSNFYLSDLVFSVYFEGFVAYPNVSTLNGIWPTLYLSSNVKVNGGTENSENPLGSEENPFTLIMEE